MKSRETLIRLKKFQVDEKRRRVAQIEGMIAEFDRIAGDLEREIKTEQDRAGIHYPAHFAYPTYAKAAIQNGDYATAERKLLAEQKIFPAKPEVLLNLAAVYSKTGRHSEARAVYDRVLALDPVAMDVADGQVAPSHLIAHRGLRLLDSARQASR